MPAVGSSWWVMSRVWVSTADSCVTGERTLGGHLARLVRNQGAWTIEPIDDPQMGDVYSLERDTNDNLWAATWGTGIHKLGEKGWTAYRADPEESGGGAPDDLAVALLTDRSGSVWVGTYGHGLARYDPLTDAFSVFRGPRGDFEYMSTYLWPIVEDDSGALWFGANETNGGIHRLSADRTTLAKWPTGGDPARPNSGKILTLHVSGDSVVWFGTQGAGLGRLDLRTDSIRYLTMTDGLPHDNVAGILEDDAGYLWISTNRGLARLDPRTNAFWVFRENAGAQGDRFFANSAYKASDGLLYFGGENGLNVIDPKLLVPRDQPPAVVLTRFSVNQKERPAVNNITARDGLRLRPGENYFTLDFAALDFTEVSQNTYRYRLDGLEPDWIDNGPSGTAIYTFIPPGEYTFVAEARNSEGIWSEAGLSIPISVLPRFYATLWFQLGVATMVAFSLWAIYAYRAKQLARVAAMRLRIAGELHDDIGANLSAIALKSELVRKRSTSDPAEQSLNDIERLARDTTQKVREMIWVVKEENDTLNGLLTRMQDVSPTLVRGVLACEFIVEGAIPVRPIEMELRQDVYSIFKEALQNVLKHADATEVTIRVSYATPYLKVSVWDDGVGFDEKLIRHGHGLASMRSRAHKHQADLQVLSLPGQGTRVEIKVPID
jgi:signal transduction histidine kinase